MEMQKELLFSKSCEMNDVDKVGAWLTLADDLKVDINAANDSGFTAAHLAARGGHTKIIQMLADTGMVNLNKETNGLRKKGLTALSLALQKGHFQVAALIMEQDKINFRTENSNIGGTVAGYAIEGGLHCVQLLANMEKFDCWNIPDKFCMTPIEHAILNKQFEILKILLNCPRVDPNLLSQGNSPVMKAVKESNNEILRILLNCPRVDPNLLSQGDSPVMKAVKDEKTAIAMMLIRNPRVDLRTRDIDNNTLQKIARWEKTKT